MKLNKSQLQSINTINYAVQELERIVKALETLGNEALAEKLRDPVDNIKHEVQRIEYETE
jgi:hypothetical protein